MLTASQYFFVVRSPPISAMWFVVIQTLFITFSIFGIASALVLSFAHRPTFLRNTSKDKHHVGLVIAHPDDESMFFVPTLKYLQENGHQVSLLCLSTGNADGLGAVRQNELRAAAVYLGIPYMRVKIIDDQTHLADGMNSKWSIIQAREHIQQFVQADDIDTVCIQSTS